MTHSPIDKLNDYIDDILQPAERAEVEAHVAACVACRESLDELRGVVERAGRLGSLEPERDLWSGIAARIGVGSDGAEPAARSPIAAREPRRFRWHPASFTFTLPQLAAAAVLVAVLSSAAVWILLRGPAARTAAPGDVPGPVAGSDEGIDATQVAAYASTIADLEQTLERHRDRLDAATVDVIESNLAVIDAAIADSRKALAADPASPYLYRHLDRQMQQKVDLLRQANQYAYASTEENPLR
jgi:anti-sigma factor RsiW